MSRKIPAKTKKFTEGELERKIVNVNHSLCVLKMIINTSVYYTPKNNHGFSFFIPH